MFWIAVIALTAIAAWYFFPEKKLPDGKTINRLVVHKSQHKMEAWSGSELLKTYTISLGKIL